MRSAYIAVEASITKSEQPYHYASSVPDKETVLGSSDSLSGTMLAIAIDPDKVLPKIIRRERKVPVPSSTSTNPKSSTSVLR